MHLTKSQAKVLRFIFDNQPQHEVFDMLDFRDFPENTKDLMIACKKLREKDLEINAENILVHSGLDACVHFMSCMNELDLRKMYRKF